MSLSVRQGDITRPRLYAHFLAFLSNIINFLCLRDRKQNILTLTNNF